MADVSSTVCANTECRVAESGTCIEGLELKNCPHYGKTPTTEKTVAETQPADKGESENRDDVLLPSAARLVVGEVNSVLRTGDSRVIATIGPHRAGKTSLIAAA